MESKEERLAKQVAEVAELARKNKKLDAPAMVEMLMKSHANAFLTQKEKVRAYILTIVIPPAGLYYFLKFYFRDEADARLTAWVCLALGIVSLALEWWLLSVLFSSSSTINQFGNMTPGQIQELTQ